METKYCNKKVVLRKSAKHIAFLNFGSFPGTIMFTVGFTYEEILKYCKQKYKDWVENFEPLKKVFDDECWGFAARRQDSKEVYSHFICIKDQFNFSDEDHLHLAHEVLHIISFNLRTLCDPMEENEALCYTHSHVMRQCYEVLRS